jgi:nucleoside-diphosphate-sugar epimerase
MSRVLVTGASGFLGRAVVAAFAKQGNAVRAAVRSAPHPPFGDGVELIKHPDLAEPIDWQPLLDGMDVVIHLAGIAHIAPGVGRETLNRVNRAATEQAASAAARAGVRRFIYVSSIRAQCGPSADHILVERDSARPYESYGRSKLAAEEAIRSSGAPFTVLRPVPVYGQGAKGNFPALWRAAASPWPLPLGKFTNRRSLLGIDNFISAVTFILGAPSTLGETYIVADPGRALSICEMMATLRKAQNRRPLLWPIPTALFATPLRLLGRGDLWQRIGGNLQADSGKLIAAGWRPLHDTATGLTAMVQTAAPRTVGTAEAPRA